jgi:uncharacterized coiled-coil protein SlyX
MKNAAGVAVLLLALSAGHAAAQRAPADPRTGTVRTEVEEIVERSGVIPALEALADAVAPELERTAEQLTATLNALAKRIADDPELRASALCAAHNGVEVAETVVLEQTTTLQEALRALAERLEARAAARQIQN